MSSSSCGTRLHDLDAIVRIFVAVFFTNHITQLLAHLVHNTSNANGMLGNIEQDTGTNCNNIDEITYLIKDINKDVDLLQKQG